MGNLGIEQVSGELVVVPSGSVLFAALGCAEACRGYRVESGRTRRRLELPTGAVTVVFGFDQSVCITDATAPGHAVTMASLVCGIRATATIGEHCGRVSGVELSLTPPMAYAVFGGVMDEMANAMVDPVELLGPAVARIGERLAHCTNWCARFALLDRLLADRLSRGTRCCPEVAWAWRQLHGGASTGVGELLVQTGWSRRRMERRFRQYIGQSPKAVAQIARLQRTLQLLDTAMPLAQVAADAGYHDQAHLAHVLKAMAGRTPSRLRAERAGSVRGVGTDRLTGRVTSAVLSG